MTDKIRSCNSSIPESKYNQIFREEEKMEKWICKSCKEDVSCELTIIEINEEKEFGDYIPDDCPLRLTDAKPNWQPQE